MNVAILAGGRGRRLGGVEKGLVEIGGRKIIEIILDSLKDFNSVIVCRDEEQAKLYSVFGEVTVDIYRGMGPLAGIHSALSYFSEEMVVVGADMPFVSSEVCRYLLSQCRGVFAVVPVWGDGRFEPTLSAYSPHILSEVEECLRRGDRKVICAFERLGNVKYISVDELRKFDASLLTFFNINTPEDLKLAERIINKF